MTIEILLLILILIATLVLFSLELVSADVIGLGVMIALPLTGLLTPQEAFAGFGSDAVILILGLLIMTAGLVRTGAVDVIGRWILRRTGEDQKRMMLMVMIGAAALSAFMSNTAATAFFVPIAIGLANRTGTNSARLLMPIAFAAILSSSVTLISSSSNIIVSGVITSYDMPPLGLFELTLVGIPILIAGLIYMFFIGRRMIPIRPEETVLEDQGRTLPYSTEIVVLPDSPLVGKTIPELAEDDTFNLRVVKVGEENGAMLIPNTGRTIQAGDVMLVEGQRDELLKIKDTAGIDFRIAEPKAEVEPKSEMTTVEGIVLPGSTLIGQSLRRLRFRERYGIQVLGIHRSGRTIEGKISRMTLRVGDQLILKAEPERIALLGRTGNVRIIGGLDDAVPNRPKARWAAGIFAVSLLLGAVGIVPLSVAALLGGFLMLVTRTLSPEEAYREVEWRVLILIGSMLAVGQAMETTGAASLFAGQISDAIGQMPVWVLLSVFFFLTLLLTQPMSNQAAAVVVVPVAVQTALQLGLNPRTFAVIIAVAASTSYMTPLEPAGMIVYGSGRYRFFDFLKVGTPLTALVYLIAILLVPLIWPVR